MNNIQIKENHNKPSQLGWRCGLVSLSEQGYERFEEEDGKVIQWLSDALTSRLGILLLS